MIEQPLELKNLIGDYLRIGEGISEDDFLEKYKSDFPVGIAEILKVDFNDCDYDIDIIVHWERALADFFPVLKEDFWLIEQILTALRVNLERFYSYQVEEFLKNENPKNRTYDNFLEYWKKYHHNKFRLKSS